MSKPEQKLVREVERKPHEGGDSSDTAGDVSEVKQASETFQRRATAASTTGKALPKKDYSVTWGDGDDWGYAGYDGD